MTNIYSKGKPIKYSSDVHKHLDKYWKLSMRFFEEGDFALASFFAITLIEEVGKIIYLSLEKISEIKDDELSQAFKKAVFDHNAKYHEAVRKTLVVNSRVTSIYGEKENKFASWFKHKKLFKIRNNALYLEPIYPKYRVPSQAITKDDAFLLVCFSGEIYGDIQGNLTGTGPDEWKRIIKEVDAFRQKICNNNDNRSEV